MVTTELLIISSVSIIGLTCGIAIFLAHTFLPKENPKLKEAEKIYSHLPGINCGACGNAGCFAYAQALAQEKNTLKDNPCMPLMQDEKMVKELTDELQIEMDLSEMNNVAIIHCDGDSEIISNYHGINTCKAAVQLQAGPKRCPYACQGLGDCKAVCPFDAIYIDEVKKIAVIDSKKCVACGLCVKECPLNLIELVPRELTQYLASNYRAARKIPGREHCTIGCIHCKRCIKVSKNNEVIWDEEKDLPVFNLNLCPAAPEAVEACPKNTFMVKDLKEKEKTVDSSASSESIDHCAVVEQ